MRLNVTALLDEEVAGKFLVVVAEDAAMDQLVDKLQRTLRRGDINSSVERIQNSLRAVLPHDELLGDMLRDGEEIFVVLRGQDGQLMSKKQSPAPHHVPQQGNCYSTQSVNAHTPSCAVTTKGGAGAGYGNAIPMKLEMTVPPDMQDEESSDDEPLLPAQMNVAPYPPPPHMVKGGLGHDKLVPGPMENFEFQKMPYDVVQVDHPCDPVQPASYDNDWLIESLTPQLREWVMEHFSEDLITVPKYVSSINKFVGPRFYQACGSFISIFMRPQVAQGSDPANTMPVHYNIAKNDLLTFQRKAEAHIDKAQQHLSLFAATMRGLQALLQKGMSESDHISEMLPHSYNALDEVEGMMIEVDRPLIPKIEGSNPILIVDTSGAVGEHLAFVKAALKRALYAHIGDKRSFQLIRFQPAGGEPRLWMRSMVPPVDDALCSAESWIENLQPCSGAKLVNGLRYAMSHQDCDSIYLISTADVEKAQHDSMLSTIRQLNVREVHISTIGVEPQALGELLLRNIAESNHGDFVLKSFSGYDAGPAYCKDDEKWISWRTNLVNEKSKQLSDSFKKPRMTIGSQVRIIEVMQREEKQKEESWREEWKCTQRLLLSAEKCDKYGVSADRDMVKELERKAGRTLAARTGGGFVYQTQELDLGLEKMFEHQSAVPWTANSDTAATGPRVPTGNAGQARIAKFPPSRELLPEAVLPMPERRVRPKSAGGSNPWASSPRNQTRRLPPMQNSARKAAPAQRAPSPRRAASPAGSGRGSRAASADRAGGPRAPSPARQASPGPKGGRVAQAKKAQTHTFTSSPMPSAGQLLPAVASASPAAPQNVGSPQTPRLERRWSF